MLDYDIAFLKGDHAAMDTGSRSGSWKDLEVKTGFLHARGLRWRIRGHLQQAGIASHRAVDHAQQVGQAGAGGTMGGRQSQPASNVRIRSRSEEEVDSPHSHFPGIAKRSTVQLSPWHFREMLPASSRAR